MLFRKLTADEIVVKAVIEGNKINLLLHKDARVDQNILDSTVGAMNWQRDHKIVGNTFCGGIGIYDSSKSSWIWKWDAGTAQLQEADKSQASDSYKRAATNWGIGRELYTAKKLNLVIEGKDIKNFTPAINNKKGFIEDTFKVLKVDIKEEDEGINKYISFIQIGVFEKETTALYKVFNFYSNKGSICMNADTNNITQENNPKKIDLCELDENEVLRIGRLRNRTIKSLIVTDKNGNDSFIPDFIYLLKWVKNTTTSYHDAKTQEQYIKLKHLADIYA